ADAQGRHAPLREPALEVVEVDAQPEDLREPAAAALQVQQPRLVEPPDVAGDELVHRRRVGELDGRLGVAHHHVRAPVHDQPAPLGPLGAPSAGSGRSLSSPPGIATPTASGWVAASSGGRYAIRAVASVCPYITYRSMPRSCPRRA